MSWRNLDPFKTSLNYEPLQDETTMNIYEPLDPFDPPEIRTSRKKIILSQSFFALGSILCIVEITLASSWTHWFGIGLAFVYLMYCGVSSWKTGQQEIAFIPDSKLVQTRRKILKFLFWILHFVGFSTILLLVGFHLFGNDHPTSEFPSSCDQSSNCCRLGADQEDSVAEEQIPVPLIFPNTSTSELLSTVKDWLHDDRHWWEWDYLTDEPKFLQVRFTSLFWGFADDFYVLINETIPEQVQLYVQSESRLGHDDYDVNYERVHDMVDYLLEQL